MRIPKGADIQIKVTDDGALELQVTAAVSTRAQAAELVKCIKHIALALETEPRRRKNSKPTAAAA